ncbi:MAG: ABC transporter ATP-binding protein [Alphaproteobacteria bacterium]|nr:ABC transporter ATP-binding protein [Alphaproteobacteria bacterium]
MHVTAAPTVDGGALLSVEGLKAHLFTPAGVVRAVDGVSFSLAERETLCIVGESGCGKSMTALAIMGLLPEPAGRIVEGRIALAGEGDLAGLPEARLRAIRGNVVSMIFQEPMSSLNPVFEIGYQVAEVILQHRRISRREAEQQAVDMLRTVGIPSPERRAHAYPHQLSGGMRQRVMIAIALACRPRLMLADEPTTALDVTIQAQILDLMNRLKEEVGTAIVLITHNMGVVAEMAQRVCVMYAGVVVEEADVEPLFEEPLHPYTRGLLGSIPRPDRRQPRRARLHTIPGSVPNLRADWRGCRFADRCSEVMDVCRRVEPPLAVPEGKAPGHKVRCWLHLPTPMGA